jgi:hypothetical protein
MEDPSVALCRLIVIVMTPANVASKNNTISAVAGWSKLSKKDVGIVYALLIKALRVVDSIAEEEEDDQQGAPSPAPRSGGKRTNTERSPEKTALAARGHGTPPMTQPDRASKRPAVALGSARSLHQTTLPTSFGPSAQNS